MKIKPIYEFLLWDNCNNNCKFCFQRKNPRIFSLDIQQRIVFSIIDFLNSDNYIDNSNVLLVGGEIFDIINRFDFLICFFKEISKLHEAKKIDHLYINTNLIYKDSCLEKVNQILALFKNTIDRVHFTTSYDIEGRFKTEEDKKIFLNNLSIIRKNNNELPIFVNIILTSKMCSAILTKKEDIFSFKEKYKIELNLIPYIILNPELFSNREIIFKTLLYIKNENLQFFNKQMEEFNLKQERKMFLYDNNSWKSCECKCLPCGHSENFKMYSNNNSCFVCDINEIFNF